MITNLREIPVEIHVTNGSRPFIDIPPGRTIYTRALLQNPAAAFFRVIVDGQCEAIYREEFGGYLVLN